MDFHNVYGDIYTLNHSCVIHNRQKSKYLYKIIIFTKFTDILKGVRIGMLIAGIGTGLATILKIFSVGTNLFWLVLLCQAILAATQTLILGLPPKLAAIWFGPNQVLLFLFNVKISKFAFIQVSSACALGIFGSQLGIALGFIVPPVLVKNHDDIDRIGDDLYYLTCLVAGVMTIVVTAIILCM